MSAATDIGAEREVDLLGLWHALVARWWIAAAGLIAGAIIGALYTLSGGTSYQAAALIAPGQAFSPNGSTTVLTYLTSRLAINVFVNEPQTLADLSAKTGVPVSQLSGHVAATPEIDPTTGASTTRVIQITATLPQPQRAEDAANALAQIVQRHTTSNYVRQSLSTYKVRLANYDARIDTLNTRIAALNKVIAHSSGMALDEQLLLATNLDSAEAQLGSTLDSQTTTQQELILAQTVEQTQLLQTAKAEKTPARSRRSAIVVGAVIGLIIGAIVAIVAETRARRARMA